VISTGAADVFVVRGPRGEVLLPAIDDVILKLDTDNREVIVHLLPGILEDKAS